jgi:hypothetical protein
MGLVFETVLLLLKTIGEDLHAAILIDKAFPRAKLSLHVVMCTVKRLAVNSHGTMEAKFQYRFSANVWYDVIDD